MSDEEWYYRWNNTIGFAYDVVNYKSLDLILKEKDNVKKR